MPASAAAVPSPSPSYALLDDAASTDAEPRSRLYTGYVGMLPCAGPDDLDALRTCHGLHVVGLFSYAFCAPVQSPAPLSLTPSPSLPHPPSSSQSPSPGRLLLFERCAMLSASEVALWLEQQAAAQTKDTTALAGVAGIRPSISQAAFDEAMARLHAYIAAGDVYQVNYTLRLYFEAFGSPPALYRRLRERQPVPFGALIALDDGTALLSFSPELFVRHVAGTLHTRPMKGTAPASDDAEADVLTAEALARDPKNRAENLMIVDLMRNDLGRIARPGSVQVPALFEVERYRSVLQMTSRVQAELRPEIGLPAIFRALFPCGSITGAPKRRAMQIIDELETTPRDIYTGAIGWFDAPAAGRALGDFCLSVPIRTLALDAPRADGLRPGVMGVGAGIVHDSVAADEYAECLLKARFLSGLAPQFSLFETMYASRAGGCRHRERHLQRIAGSAVYFGITLDRAAMRQALDAACRGLLPEQDYRLRLSLAPDGTIAVEAGMLTPLPVQQGRVRLMVSTQPCRQDPWLLAHKTSSRAQYDAAWRLAESRGCFDMLFFNLQGKLTEGARSNVFIRKDGRWLTPPLAAGVLPGIMRAAILADPGWYAREQMLGLEDLLGADEIMVCNALRGVLPARLELPD